MTAQPLPEWVKAILREKYPRPDPLGEAAKGAADVIRVFGERLGTIIYRIGQS